MFLLDYAEAAKHGHEIRKGLWKSIKDAMLRQYHWRAVTFLSTMSSPEDQILEMGCGTGLFTRRFQEIFGETRSLIGIDLDEDRVKEAAKRCGLEWNQGSESYSSQSARMILKKGDVTNVRLRAKSFDSIICVMVAHHLESEERNLMVKEMYRLLRPGGRALVVDHGRPTKLYGWFWWLLFRNYFHSRNCTDSIWQMAIMAGFHTPDILATQFGWTHHMVLVKPGR